MSGPRQLVGGTYVLGLISMHFSELEGRRRKSQVLGLTWECRLILASGRRTGGANYAAGCSMSSAIALVRWCS